MVSHMRRKDNIIHPVDAHVGGRLKWLRKKLGVSQERIAEAINVTFQQIQKYEKGDNRISCGKLYDIARFLKVRPSFFFGEFEEIEQWYDFPEIAAPPLAENTTDSYNPGNDSDEPAQNAIKLWHNLDKEALTAAIMLHKIRDPRVRASIVVLLELLASNINCKKNS